MPFDVMHVLQLGNPMTVTGICRIISCVLHNQHFVDACFDLEPSSCVHHDAWLHEELPELSDDMVQRSWYEVVPFMRREKVR